MKIKHFVITRFLTRDDLGYGDRIFDDDVIAESVEYVKKYFIPSLENQTNKNFEIVFLVNDKHDTEESNIRLLKELDTCFKCHVVKKSDLAGFVKSESSGYDRLITTRMDYDDLVYSGAAQEIQGLAERSKEVVFTYGYNNGTLKRGKQICKYNPKYGNGYFSVFLSLVIDLKTMPSADVYELDDHTNVRKTLKDLCGKNKVVYSDAFFKRSAENQYYFVWVRHENTASSLMKYPKENAYNEETDVKDFKERFGIEP